jgi:hypothetical protein
VREEETRAEWKRGWEGERPHIVDGHYELNFLRHEQ